MLKFKNISALRVKDVEEIRKEHPNKVIDLGSADFLEGGGASDGLKGTVYHWVIGWQ
jgi:hypothetical protein